MYWIYSLEPLDGYYFDANARPLAVGRTTFDCFRIDLHSTVSDGLIRIHGQIARSCLLSPKPHFIELSTERIEDCWYFDKLERGLTEGSCVAKIHIHMQMKPNIKRDLWT